MKIKVLKIGGNVLDDLEALKTFIKEFSAIAGPKILVHGGGKRATYLAGRLGISSPMIDGRRVTGKDMLELVSMVYSGINKELVSMFGGKALGLSGADMSLIPARKRMHPEIDYGYVGDIDPHEIRDDRIIALLREGVIPIFCALTFDKENGGLLNTNADTVAASLAISLAPHANVELIYCFEMPGVMKDVNDPQSLIRAIDTRKYTDLMEEKVISGGMLPKLKNAFDALDKGIEIVRITNYNSPEGGTMIIK